MDRLPYDFSSPADIPSPAAGAMPGKGIVALRTALQALLRRGAPDDAMEGAVALFCAEARRRDIRAERVLVLLKDVWRTLPEARPLARADRERRLARLTSLTIRTYYETSARATDAPHARSQAEHLDAGRPR